MTNKEYVNFYQNGMENSYSSLDSAGNEKFFGLIDPWGHTNWGVLSLLGSCWLRTESGWILAVCCFWTSSWTSYGLHSQSIKSSNLFPPITLQKEPKARRHVRRETIATKYNPLYHFFLGHGFVKYEFLIVINISTEGKYGFMLIIIFLSINLTV